MGKDRNKSILNQLANDYLNGEASSYDMFMAYWKEEDAEAESTEILKRIFKNLDKQDRVLSSIAYYRQQDRSEQLNKWLDFSRRFVESIKAEPTKLQNNSIYWVERISPMDNRFDNLIMYNIVDQIYRELF